MCPLTRAQCREVDRRAVEEYGIASIILMENAGRGVVDVLCALPFSGPVVVLCGKGNNAGDGFVVARHLEIRGSETHVLLLTEPADLRGDARTNYDILAKTDVPIFVFGAGAEPDGGVGSWLDQHGSGATWLVDALLGTGVSGPPRPPFDTAIRWFNDQPGQKLAVDVPSGLDCDTGDAPGACICADLTCTFVAKKSGFTATGADRYTGRVHVLDIGAPTCLKSQITSSISHTNLKSQ